MSLRYFIDQSKSIITSRPKNLKLEIPIALGYYLKRELFYKPIYKVSNQNTNIEISFQLIKVEAIMNCYGKLFNVENADKLILFPVGVLSYPSTVTSDSFSEVLKKQVDDCFYNYFIPNSFSLCKPHTPIIVFEHLSSNEGWKQLSDKPKDQYKAPFLS